MVAAVKVWLEVRLVALIMVGEERVLCEKMDLAGHSETDD